MSYDELKIRGALSKIGIKPIILIMGKQIRYHMRKLLRYYNAA